MKIWPLLFSLLLAWPTLEARADLTPREVYPCRGKQAGSKCDDGVCADATCTRLDYPNWKPDAAAPPYLDYACVKCVPEPDAGRATTDAGGTDGGLLGLDAGSAAKKDKDSGCSAGHDAAPLAAAWLVIGLAYAYRRGKRRR